MRNRARCKRCNTIIESTHRHHLVWCQCPDQTGIFLDGGNPAKGGYFRGGGDFSLFIRLLDNDTEESWNIEDE